MKENQRENEYIRLPVAGPLPDSRRQLRELRDVDWKNLIFRHLLRFYRDADFERLKRLIEDERKKKRANIEEVIKKEITQWLRNDREFGMQDFLINREPSADGVVDGFYDLKFEHGQWKHKYFPFECKNLNGTADSINEYVYKKSKNKEDGGVYRYFIGKYAPELDFGGMIGFILAGVESEIISKIIQKLLKTVRDGKVGKLLGNLLENGIKKNSIEGNPNTFDSIHLKRSDEFPKGSEFTLHHIFFDMNRGSKNS